MKIARVRVIELLCNCRQSVTTSLCDYIVRAVAAVLAFIDVNDNTRLLKPSGINGNVEDVQYTNLSSIFVYMFENSGDFGLSFDKLKTVGGKTDNRVSNR